MADKEEEVLPQGMVMDEHGAVRPITADEAEHGLHDPKDKPKEEEPPHPPPPPPAVLGEKKDKPDGPPEDKPGHAGPPSRP